MIKYSRLHERLNYLSKASKEAIRKEKDPIKYYIEMDCIEHLFCGGLDRYEEIALFCKKNNIKRVVDIGCAVGHQSECFLENDIDYMGVNEAKLNFWNKGKYTYIVGNYPCSLPTKTKDLAISV